MAESLLTFGLRASVRGARRALRTTRELSDLGLAALDLVAQALGEPTESATHRATQAGTAPVPSRNGAAFVVEDEELEDVEDLVYVDEEDAPADDPDALQPPGEWAVDHVDEGIELVGEVADPGAEDGAGASIRIDPPFPGYDALRAPDIIARLDASDTATLAAIELYEQTHRRRRTVLDALAREVRRRR